MELICYKCQSKWVGEEGDEGQKCKRCGGKSYAIEYETGEEKEEEKILNYDFIVVNRKEFKDFMNGNGGLTPLEGSEPDKNSMKIILVWRNEDEDVGKVQEVQ